jgi:hypothetical protein
MQKDYSFYVLTFVSALVLLMITCQLPMTTSNQAVQGTTAYTNTSEPQHFPTAEPTKALPQTPLNLPSTATPSFTPPIPLNECAINVHAHLDNVGIKSSETILLQSAGTAIAIMEELGIQRELIMPPPFSSRMGGYDYALLTPVIKTYPGQFSFLGGGGTLNPILHEAVRSGRVTPEMEKLFDDQAREIAASGAAGFGELAVLHLSFFARHPFMEAPPDHPLLLLLDDIAAETGIPIELHMEAVPQDIRLPEGLSAPPNATILKANITGLENLLNHNPQAKVVWAHAGWDNTGFRTVELMRDLLAKHPNLYMSIKIAPKDNIGDNIPIDLSTGSVKLEWVDLINQFPDRFVIGSDVFYGEIDDPSATPLRKVKGAWRVIAGLPTDIAYQIACENPRKIYRIIDISE